MKLKRQDNACPCKCVQCAQGVAGVPTPPTPVRRPNGPETVGGPETGRSGDHERKCRASATSLCSSAGWVGGFQKKQIKFLNTREKKTRSDKAGAGLMACCKCATSWPSLQSEARVKPSSILRKQRSRRPKILCGRHIHR